MVVKKEKKLTKKRKVVTKKKTKNKNINKNINTQTVIINQPKPTRRRKAPTKKKDIFSEPTSSLGIITNLINRFQPTQQPNDQLQQLTESVKQLQIQQSPLTQVPQFGGFLNQGNIPDPLSSDPMVSSSIAGSSRDMSDYSSLYNSNVTTTPNRPTDLRSFGTSTNDLPKEPPLARNSPVKKADGSVASIASPPPIPPDTKRIPATPTAPVIPPTQTTLPFATQKEQAELTQAMSAYDKMKIRYDEALRNDKIKKGTLNNYKSQLKSAEKNLKDIRLKNQGMS